MNRGFIAFLLLFSCHYSATALGEQWSMGYTSNTLPVSAIQWTGLTHVCHWTLLVKADGTVDTSMISSQATSLVAAAHSHNVKALLTITQATWVGQAANFDQATANRLNGLVANIMNVVNTYDYDGVDIDWEPFSSKTQGTRMTALAAALRTALGSKILTVAAVQQNESYWGTTHSYYDRLNVMTYDSAWQGNGVPWFNSPLHNIGHPTFNSVEDSVNRNLAAGVPASKLGIGLAFYGRRWRGGVSASNPSLGISGPYDAWSSGQAPAPTRGDELFYSDVLNLIGDPGVEEHFDSTQKAPYLSHPGTPSTAWYVSYDNPQSIQAKVEYAIDRGLGGWIIWGLWADYLPGGKHPLLDAVHQGLGKVTDPGPAPPTHVTATVQ